MDRLAHKFETARRQVPGPVIEENGHDVGIIAYGTSHWAVIESRDQLAREYGVETDYCRMRAFPFSDDVADFVRRHQRVYVVEQNRDAQIGAPAAIALQRRRDRPAAQRSPLRRLAHRRAQRNRCHHDPGGGKLIWQPPRPLATAKSQSHRPGAGAYKGSKSTLCAGCGHNAISERIIEAVLRDGR